MTHRSENLQPSLFEAERPCVEPRAAQESELAIVVEVLLREIAAALAKAAIGEDRERADNIACARELLAASRPEGQPSAAAVDPSKPDCPCCGGRMIIIEVEYRAMPLRMMPANSPG
jgi:hypothetical protein